MRIKDVSVRSKIMAALICVLVASIGLGSFSVVRLSALNERAADIRDNWMQGIGFLAKYEYSLTRLRVYHANMLLAKTDADRLVIDDNIAKLGATATDYWSKYTPTIASPQERILADKIQSTYASYLPMVDEERKLLKEQGADAAGAYFFNTMRPTFTEFANAVEADIDFNIRSGNESAALGASLFESSRLWIFATMGLSILLCFGSGYVLITGVSTPLVEMTKAMDELAGGNLQAHVPNADQQDEIGHLAGSMTAFKNQLVAAERSKAEQTELIVGSIGTGLENLAKGNVTHRIDAELVGPFAKLKSNFNAAMDRLQDTLKSVMASTSQITTGAGEISQASDDLSRRTEQQAASLEETAAALEEITATVKTTASNAKEARASVTTAKSAAEDGGRVVNTAIEAMDAILGSSKQITDIIGVIDEIAFQTNLLALNAGVEAARAGEAGKGFAVVASEVRSLAQRSSEAAKQIKTLINASGEQVGSGVRLVGESGAALRRIMDQVQQINSLVSEMALAAEQQSTGIEQVNAAVGQMDQVTQQNAAMVEQSTAAARNLASETQSLQELVGFFDVGRGTETVRRPEPQQRKVVKPSMPAARPAPRPVRVASRGGAQPAQAADAGDWTEF